MTRERWQQVCELLEQALELAPQQRPALLDRACDGDRSLRQDVEDLLASSDHVRSSFLEGPLFAEQTLQTESSTTLGGYEIVSPGSGGMGEVCWASDPRLGQEVGAYKLVRRVGQGGMAQVYLAVRADGEFRQEVAIKLVRAGLDSDEVLQRFRNERQTLAGLDHPNIVKLLDGGSTPERTPYLVMDYVEGSPIDEYCDEHKLSVDERLHLFGKVCEAVEYAHRKRVIHRDLKPSNILVSTDGVPKLLDFGIAKVLIAPTSDEALRLTHTGTRCMTPAYASPEQVSGKTATVATDIYSLGVVLYELLTGHRPYRLEEHTPAEMERAICEQEPEVPSAAVSRVETYSSSSGIPFTKTPELVSQTREGLPDKLRRRLRGDLDTILLKALQKEPERRYGSVAELAGDIDRHLQHLPVKARRSTLTYRASKFIRRHKIEVGATVLLVATLAVILGGMFWRSRQSQRLTEKDTVVLADFANSTGDPVFDGTLQQGLSAQLAQSPFLNLLSDEQVARTLSRMAQPKDAQLTQKLAGDVCQRTASTATIEGSISRLGGQYVLGLKAVNCHNSDLLAEEQVTANDKEQVLKALGNAATRLRERLGESMASVQKYDAPLEDVTTPSLEALNAYHLGHKASAAKGDDAALPFFKRAVELDPNFAMAYRDIAVTYFNLDEVGQAAENARKAYELREKVSERERFLIETSYYVNATGELEKAAQEAEVWQETYPRDSRAHVTLGFLSGGLGDWEKALKEGQEAVRLDPNNGSNYIRLGMYYVQLNRLNEGEAVFRQAEEEGKLQAESMIWFHYLFAFLKGDTARMTQLVAAAMGKPGIEDELLAMQAETEAWYGRLKNARELFRQAMDSAQHNGKKETAAGYQVQAALREAELGSPKQVGAEAKAALRLTANSEVRGRAALALARAGDTAAAEKLAAEVDRTLPLATLVQRMALPLIRAAVALRRKDPKQAIGLLKVASATELGADLGPAYLRGEAYLMLHDGNAAAAEYQKFIDHRGLVENLFLGALARLGLARAYAVQGNTVKARAAYQDFLNLWKDADPDIAIYKQAKAEYAKLK